MLTATISACDFQPLRSDADDLRAMYHVMAGAHAADPWSKALPDPERTADLSTVRVGFALLVGNPAIEPEVAAGVEAAIDKMAALIAGVEAVTLDFYRHEPQFRVLLETMLAGRLAEKLEQAESLFDPSLAHAVRRGLGHSGTELHAASALRTAMFGEVERLFETVDVIVTPTLAAASLPADTDPHGDVVIGGTDAGPIRAGWYPYTWPLNLTGHPALSMPCGWTSEGLPVGLQLVGRWYAEELLLDIAAALESALAVERREWCLNSG